MVSGKLLFKLYSKMSLCPYKIFLAHQRADKDVTLLRKYQLMLWALIKTSLALTFTYQQLQSSDLNVQMTFSNYTKHHRINFIHQSFLQVYLILLFFPSYDPILFTHVLKLRCIFFLILLKLFFFFFKRDRICTGSTKRRAISPLQGETQCLETFFDCLN